MNEKTGQWDVVSSFDRKTTVVHHPEGEETVVFLGIIYVKGHKLSAFSIFFCTSFTISTIGTTRRPKSVATRYSAKVMLGKPNASAGNGVKMPWEFRSGGLHNRVSLL